MSDFGAVYREGEQRAMLVELREDSLNRKPIHFDHVSISHWGMFPTQSNEFENYNGRPDEKG